MNEVLLVTISGHDQRGVTASLTATMARHQLYILDIGQAVIHDTLTLGMLVEVPADIRLDAIETALEQQATELGLRIRFQTVAAESYADWVEQQGKARYIITVLARKLSAEHIARVSAVAARQHANIDNITRLSGRVALRSDNPQTSACVEFSVRGEPADKKALRADLMTLANELDIDIAFQTDNIFRRNRRLVCFDMDSTLIEAEVIDELAKAAGVGSKVVAITERAMAGELDFKASFRQRLALLKGLDETVLEKIAQQLPITEGAQRLIRTLKKVGYKTAILSGGFDYFGRYLQQKLGIDYVYANELDIVDGKLTGEVKGNIVDGEMKALLLRKLAAREGIALDQVIAVGDGANDLPMLNVAGLGIAFRAKALVRESASHAISNLGLDAILYLIGFRDREDINL